MKKIVLAATMILLMSGSVQARGYGGGYHRSGSAHYYGGGWGYGGWVAPLLFGGVLGYAASRPTVVYDSSPTVVYTTQPQTMVIQSSTPAPVVQENNMISDDPSGYEERWVYFEDCQCERKVLVNMRQ